MPRPAPRSVKPLSASLMAGLLPVLLLSSGFAPQPAHAQARPDTRSMTCAQAQALVQQRGEIVMNTGPHTFERFIAHAGFCYMRSPMTRPVYAPTRDNKKCAVGKKCFRPRMRD